MTVKQRTDLGFDLTAPVSTIFKLRDELEAAWDEGDTFVVELTDKLGGYDDDSTEEITVVLEADVAPDAADVLENGSSPELEEIGAELQKLMDAHNEQALDEAERAG
jgi:aspartate-semialdehyde dehydrogenase